ncbi:MAG: flagellin [Burkholderiaceae bacterium]|jgi:flagellin|nr:flagellin [Burkholderiaceae bacterium]
MPQIINTNISSLNSQRHLNNSQSALAQAMERLSSGKRINSAKDDAAGLNIAEKMTTQVGGMNQAIRNSYDGVSLGQTAESALTTSGDMLQRIRVLAVQASNATNSAQDRLAIQKEVAQLASELNRIAETTSFNGQKLLNGTMGTQYFQVGANAGELISANGTNFLTSVYGNNRIQADEVEAKAYSSGGQLSSGAVTVSGNLGSKEIAITEADTAKRFAAKVNEVTDTTGVKATARTTAVLTDFEANTAYTLALAGDNAKDGKTASLASVSFTIGKDLSNGDSFASAINAINAQSSKTGITAEFDANNKGIKLTHSSGENIVVGSAVGTTISNVKLGSYKSDGDLVTGVALTAFTDATGVFSDGIAATGSVTYDSEASFSIQDGTALKTDQDTAAGITNGASCLRSVASLDVSTFESAQASLAICDAAIGIINGERARYGALQRRFEATIDNLRVSSENTSNARSRIKDADYAEETAALSRASILQQAGTAMLAQANQIPQTVLSLIR